jgi:hypothetical protein
MNPFLEFLCCLAGMALFGFIVSRITGARAQFMETLALESGERVLWEDLTADAFPIPTRQALFTSYSRSRRGAVRVTNLRIICGTKSLFGEKHMVMHLLYPSDRTYPKEADAIGGGLLTRGYQAFVFQRLTVQAHPADQAPYVELTLDPAVASSMNLRSYRIHSDRVDAFCLPE